MIIIERFEGSIAILEDTDTSKHIEVDRVKFPPNAKEGDVVELRNGAYAVDEYRTSERRNAAVSRLRKMGL
jgi:hypothetical protein